MPSRRPKLFLMATAALAAISGAAHAEDAGDRGAVVSELVVSTARQTNVSATGLELTVRETPQSVTVIPQEQIRDFNLTEARELLALTPGINVDAFETNRTYYDARGFRITNFQFDGVGLPLIRGLQYADIDTIIFDHVEAVRGADSLLTGVGNPSATINFVRKRPTMMAQGEVSAQYGSWDDKRVEGDVSGPLNASGSLRGRLVAAGQASDSYLDHYKARRNVAYGVLAWDATERLTLTAGYSRQDDRARGVLWGALPLSWSDATRIDYPVSASTSADWTYWNILDQTAFVEAAYRLPHAWSLKATLTWRSVDEDAKLLYAFGAPDPVTGLGVAGVAGVYPAQYRQALFDVTASGPFTAFGRRHELVLGASAARGTGKEWEGVATSAIAFPPIGQWSTQQVAEPEFFAPSVQAEQVDKLYRIYAATHLNLADRLKATLGVSLVKLKSTGFSYGVDTPRYEEAASPFAGVVFDLTPQVSLYASYTDIFNPQSEADINHQTLAAAHGKSYEAGLKSEWFDKRLLVSIAGFRAEQLGLAEYAGVFPDAKSYYRGVDTKVTGYEIEAAGRVTDRWTLSGGYTDLKIEGEDGQPVRSYTPRRTLKAMTTYAFPELRNLKLGAAVRWQSEVSVQDLAVVTQGAYAVADLTAGVDLTPKIRATLLVRNVGDDHHVSTLEFSQAYYAAPRSVEVRLDYAF